MTLSKKYRVTGRIVITIPEKRPLVVQSADQETAHAHAVYLMCEMDEGDLWDELTVEEITGEEE